MPRFLCFCYLAKEEFLPNLISNHNNYFVPKGLNNIIHHSFGNNYVMFRIVFVNQLNLSS